jgi:hypothetical protein
MEVTGPSSLIHSKVSTSNRSIIQILIPNRKLVLKRLWQRRSCVGTIGEHLSACEKPVRGFDKNLRKANSFPCSLIGYQKRIATPQGLNSYSFDLRRIGGPERQLKIRTWKSASILPGAELARHAEPISTGRCG